MLRQRIIWSLGLLSVAAGCARQGFGLGPADLSGSEAGDTVNVGDGGRSDGPTAPIDLSSDGQVPDRGATDQGSDAIAGSDSEIGCAGTWTKIATGTTATLRDVWGSSANSVWAVGDGGTVLHWNGGAWSAATTPATAGSHLRAIHGTAAADVLTTGLGSAAFHFDGSSWSDLSPSLDSYWGLWGDAWNDYRAVGEGGAIGRWDGTSWANETSPDNTTLQDVWGSGANNVWAVGFQSMVLHYDGVGWSSVDVGVAATFHSAFGTSANNVWIVGDARIAGTYYARMLHRRSTGWYDLSPPDQGYRARDVTAGAGGMTLVVGHKGEAGLILTREANTWTDVTPAGAPPLEAIWAIDDCEIWAVGGDGAAFRHH